MKIGVLSDTHISGGGLHPKKLASRYLHKVVTPAEELCEKLRPHFSGVDMIIHAGDVASAGVLEALLEFGPVECVAGNMDPPEITSRCPARREIEAAGYRIGVMHGWGASSGLELKVRREFDGADLIIFGHSHYPFNKKVDGVLMFNPGSATDRRNAPNHTIGLIELGDGISARHVALD